MRVGVFLVFQFWSFSRMSTIPGNVCESAARMRLKPMLRAASAVTGPMQTAGAASMTFFSILFSNRLVKPVTVEGLVNDI